MQESSRDGLPDQLHLLHLVDGFVHQTGRWTYRALWNQVWSFAGNSARSNVNQMFFQPFLAYNTTSLWTITLQPESTANWEAPDQKWPWLRAVRFLATRVPS